MQTVKRVINWLKNKDTEKSAEIIDIGTGNGFTCFKLVNICFLDLNFFLFETKNGIFFFK